jgi:hypothetical protein
MQVKLPSGSLPLPSEATRVLEDAIRAVPAVRYALGVAGVGAAGSLLLGFATSIQIAVFGVPVFLVLMVGLLLFAGLTKAGPGILHGPMMVMVWVFTLLICAALVLLFTGWAFNWPPAVSQMIYAATPAPLAAPTSTYNLPSGLTFTQVVWMFVKDEGASPRFKGCSARVLAARVREGLIRGGVVDLIAQLQYRLVDPTVTVKLEVKRDGQNIVDVACK